MVKSEESSSAQRTIRDVAYQFLVGALLGLVVALIPLAISMPGLELWNAEASALLVLLCATLSALVGDKFLSAFIRLLESFPPIA